MSPGMCGWPITEGEHKEVTRVGAQSLGHTGGGRPPRHIPVIVGVGGVGLLDLGDRHLAVLGLPALGGLLDLPGLALGGGELDLNVYVGHGSSRFCLRIDCEYEESDISGRGHDPNSNGE